MGKPDRRYCSICGKELFANVNHIYQAEIATSRQNVTPPAINSSEWLSGIGVIGWKRVMSRELFATESEARQWAESHGLKDVEYIPASMPKDAR